MDITSISDPPPRCLQCGCPHEDWPNREGYGVNFCCEGCAKGARCTCGAAKRAVVASDARTGIRPGSPGGPST